MTKARRRVWAGADRDMVAANRGRMSRRNNIPTGVNPAERLAAVQANVTSKRHNDPQSKGTEMHSAIRADLIAKMRRLSSDERNGVLTAAAETDRDQTGKTRAAEAVARLVSGKAPTSD